MKRLALGCSFLFLLAATAKAEPLLRPNDRVAICGGGYSIYLEDYLLACQPIPGLDVAQFEWSAGDPAGFLARFNTDMLPFKPTVVLTYFWGDVNTYGKTQTDLIEALKKAGVRTIVMGSPKCVDSFGYQHDPVKAAAENRRLAALAEIAKDVAAKEGMVYADVYGESMAAMHKAKAVHGKSYVFENEAGEACSLVIASAFLKALGCDGSIGTITIDFAANKAEGTPGQKVVSFKDNTLTVESTRIPFWFPGHGVGATGPLPWPILKCLTFDKELNRYILVVKNLPTAQTKIYWGDQQLDFSSEELAKGVNLAAVMPGWGNPFAGRFSDVDNGVRVQQQEERIAGSAMVQGKPDPQADAKREAALQVAKNRAVPVKTKIVIQPLAPVEKQPKGPIPVILDTDLDGDVDDVGALAILNSFMVRGEANLIACVHNTSNVQLSSCATIQAVNAYYGHPSIPIGQYHGESGPKTPMTSVLLSAPPKAYHGPAMACGSSYTLPIHQRFCPDFPNDDKLPAGVDVYRKALASAADGTVVIASVGMMENLQDLIQSQPDSVSKLNGLDLVRKKVRQLVIMANTQPQDGYILNKWPTKIVWTTYVGSGIGTGPSLINTPENNPVRMAYKLFGDEHHNALKDSRASWDLTASWLAVRGPGDVFDVVAGRPQFVNDITHSPAGPYPHECEVTIKMPYPDVAKRIGDELARPPKRQF